MAIEIKNLSAKPPPHPPLRAATAPPKVIVLSNLGTERTGKFPWNLQNGLGGSLTKNGEGEQVLVEVRKKT